LPSALTAIKIKTTFNTSITMSNKHKIDFQSLSIAEVLPLFGKHSTFVEYKHKVKMKHNPFIVDMLLFNRQLQCFVAVNIRKMLQIQEAIF
jgi:hypothetical protein